MNSATSVNSLKSAITTRVNPVDAERLFNDSRFLGNPEMCPKSAMNPDVDEWGRPQGGARHRLLLLNDASCSSSVYSLGQKIRHENAERAILGPCRPGDRGGGDFYGKGRDNFPKNLYGEGNRGNFVSPYKYLRQPEFGTPKPNYTTPFEPASARQFNMSQDALVTPYLG